MNHMDINYTLTNPESTGWGNFAAIKAQKGWVECLAEHLPLDIACRSMQVITKCAHLRWNTSRLERKLYDWGMAHCPPLVGYIVNKWFWKVTEMEKEHPAVVISSKMLDTFLKEEACICKMSNDLKKRCNDAGSLYMVAYNARRLAEEQYDNAPKRSKARAEAKINLDEAKCRFSDAWYHLCDLEDEARNMLSSNREEQKTA